MRHLSVYQRLAMIIAVLSIAFFAVSAMQITVLRDAVLDERRTTIRDMVDAAVKIPIAQRGGGSTVPRQTPIIFGANFGGVQAAIAIFICGGKIGLQSSLHLVSSHHAIAVRIVTP